MMNQLLNNQGGSSARSKNRGCLFLVLGSLLALLATGIYIVLVSLLTRTVIEARHGGEAVYALMTLAKGSYGVVLILFYAILALWYVAPSQEEVDRQNRQFGTTGGPGGPAAKAMSRRTLWLISGGIFLGVILCGAVSLNTYTLVSDDGIRTYCFAETGRYDWEDVSAYSVDCDASEGLSVTFAMQGGKQFEILHGVNSATDKFKATYTSTTHFAAELDKRLMTPTDDHAVPPRNMSSSAYDRAVSFYRDSYPDLWPHVSRLIGYEEMELSPDETAAETVTETVAST